MIPVYKPSLSGNEKAYVNECLDTGWISSRGEFVGRFERAFGRFVGTENCVAVCNGTVALHLALVALGIGQGDEVIVPTLTYIASVNAIAYAGAKPVFVDSLPDTWQMDPAHVAARITPRTKAVLAVHLYGQPCDLEALRRLCNQHELALIEDCAEALGSGYSGAHVGTLGDVSTFSFFGNKTITTGEGGMVITKTRKLYDRCVYLKGQAVSPTREYWHGEIGFNYRMTNVCAAIGLAQIENVKSILERKRRIAAHYRESLQGLPLTVCDEATGTRNSYWMCSIVVDDAQDRDALRDHLRKSGIETRPFFYPAHRMPVYWEDRSYPIAERLGASGINLPSWPGLKLAELVYICQSTRAFFRRQSASYVGAAWMNDRRAE